MSEPVSDRIEPPAEAGPYDTEFYDDIDAMSVESAAVIVPWLVGALAPRSVLDVGCGRGAWLAQFSRDGVSEVVGLDGDYVDPAGLHIQSSEFVAADLLEPPELDRSFDLVVSLEVAEHLPASVAASFVRYLAEAAPVVLFSAAIPGQGGVHHVNEQWPEYWARHFDSVGYHPIDAVRPKFWDDERVAFYFAQNTVVYARADVATDVAERLGSAVADADLLALAHPRLLDELRAQGTKRHQAPPSFSSLLRALPSAGKRAVTARLKRDPQR
jgi:SAM-dependent methyltransferase